LSKNECPQSLIVVLCDVSTDVNGCERISTFPSNMGDIGK
jgi:hypothetical protein